jgi:HD-like signal output (HDOD) protein
MVPAPWVLVSKYTDTGEWGHPGRAMTMQPVKEELQKQLLQDYRDGRLALPSMPEVAWRIRDAVGREDRSLGEVARLVQLDPALAARLVQIANSPRYRTAHPVKDCLGAVTRLGIEATRNLATSLALRNVYQGDNAAVRRYLREAWLESCRVGAVCQVLASVTPGLKPDRALLAGLVHNIGVLPALQYFERFPELMDDSGRLDEVVAWVRGHLGGLLLRHWRFDPALAAVAEQSDAWWRKGEAEPDYVDLVLVARVFAHFGQAEALGAPSLDEMPAFLKFPISRFGPDAALQTLQEAQREIAGMIRTLQSA